MRTTNRIRKARLLLEQLEQRLAPAVQFTIDPTLDRLPISRFIYGVNSPLAGPTANLTLERLGGNRWSAYNWENNASNAGSDWYFQNDAYLGGGDTPGGAVLPTLQNAYAHNAAALITVPINGYVAADKRGDGDVRNSANYLQTRFNVSDPTKGAPFSLTPDLTDGKVYADEFVNWVITQYPGAQTDANRPIWFSLDNEPDLWQETHAAIHPGDVTYAELVQKSIEYAAAIKAVAPGSLVFGPVNYGWHGFTTLQDAPDGAGRDFQSFYLAQMKAAETAAGRRLLDVLDVHWYPEAQGGGVRITDQNNSAAVVAARLQAPRSLWDATYTETSWITQWSTGGPINLLPRLQSKIDNNYAGTKLAITEYNYGGGDHISGGIAQADVLGIFGREGVFAASQWQLYTSEPFVTGALAMYRNYDGQNSTFGDTAVSATTTDPASSSVYASIDSNNPNVLVLVAINKTGAALPASLHLQGVQPGSLARFYTLTGASSSPQAAGQATITDPSAFSYTMPAYSVTTIRIDLGDTPPPPTLPVVSVGDQTIVEGDTGTTTARFTLTLSAASTTAVRVKWATADGTATLANQDYRSASGTVTFAAGQTSLTVGVPIVGDRRTEANEVFFVRLTQPEGATLGDAEGQGVILNNDSPVVRVNNVQVTEGNSGITYADFTLNLSVPTTRQVTVNFATSNGTALAGSDYTARSGKATFAPGVTSQVVRVAVTGDTRIEGNESFWLNLSSPVNATLGTTRASGTIVNDDSALSAAVSWSKSSDWGTGFVMEIRIRNNGSSAINGWILEFDLDADITNIWDGVLVTRVGKRYTVRAEAWNPLIAANGGEVSFGFVANTSVANAAPGNYKLNGVTLV
ncbi:MAG: glycoside hydrolase family 44 protein [Gemmataceae bacterium]